MPTIVDFKLSGRPAVAIGIPMTEYVLRSAFWRFMAMAQTMRPTDRLMPIYQTAAVGEARNTIIHDFLYGDDYKHCKYLLFFDSDMTVSIDVIEVMVFRAEKLSMAFHSAYCSRKAYPYMPVAGFRKQRSVEHWEEDVYAYHNVTDWMPDSGIRQCDAVGAAALCLRRDLLEAIPAPWFKFEQGGEDYYFCRKVQEVKTPDWPGGVPILVDTHHQIGHIGEFIATPSDWFKVKEKYFEESGEGEIILKPDPDVDSCLSGLARAMASD